MHTLLNSALEQITINHTTFVNKVFVTKKNDKSVPSVTDNQRKNFSITGSFPSQTVSHQNPSQLIITLVQKKNRRKNCLVKNKSKIYAPFLPT